VEVAELLSGTSSSAKFAFAAPKQCGAIAGAKHRAVFFGNDAENVFRFFRTFQDVTIVKGSSDYSNAAADRLVASLAPWSVRCMVVNAADVNQPREIPEDAKLSWIGLTANRLGNLQPGQKPLPMHVGFAVQGPVILLGNPDDNPLIKFLVDTKVLPYVPDKEKLPGPSRGYIAWQRDMIGIGQESVALIAYDAAGMSEAAGTLYEIAAGLEPLMPFEPPIRADVVRGDVSPAATPRRDAPVGRLRLAKQPVIQRLWAVALPDRAVALRPIGRETIAVLSQDGTLAVIDSKGKVAWQKEVDADGDNPPGDGAKLDVTADGGTIVVASHRITAFNARGKQMFDEPLFAEGNLPPVAFVAVSPDGSSVAAGSTDGRLTMLRSGKRAWTVGGVSPQTIDQWKTELAAWDADKPARDKLLADWQDADKQWQAAPAKERGPRPQRPQLAPQPQRPRPDPIFNAAFTTDGALLVALADQEARLINTADGSVTATIPGVNGGLAIQRLGANFIVSDATKPLLLSPADGKIASQVPLPIDKDLLAKYGKNARSIPSVLAANGGGLLVGCEPTGLVYSLKAMAGKPEDVIAWQTAIPDRLPKYIAPRGGIVAVACWGGTLQLLDAATGQARASQLLPHDITGLAWMDDMLAVGLADGQIVGLWMK
ncbi:MAG TPA: PQQ-binding-like beta-propeller repeat protein, partial [Planctomycetota bacterium]|nr:PQQ-binding-like beta-propeller repeat protein [Planctomycetota bacterium]